MTFERANPLSFFILYFYIFLYFYTFYLNTPYAKLIAKSTHSNR